MRELARTEPKIARASCWRTRSVLVMSALLLVDCRSESRRSQRNMLSGEEVLRVRTSALAAGPAASVQPLTNPYAGNAAALQEGKRLYTWFNCAACHGALGGGGMGPPLRDAEWIYGSEPQNVRASIIQGRPQGMPAFGKIPDDALWKLVAFVNSLGEPPAPGSVGFDHEKAQREQPRQEEHAPE